MNWRLGCPVMIALVCVAIGLFALMDKMFENERNKHAYYSTHADAAADKAVWRTKLLVYLPHSATNIQESHNSFTDEQWVRFDCDAADLTTIPAKGLDAVPMRYLPRQFFPQPIDQVTLLSVENVQFPQPRSTRKREWWPNTLREATPNTAALYDFHVDGDAIYVAIEKGRPRVWLWRTNMDKRTYYPTHAEAVADRAVYRGWVPRYIPHSATDIEEIHSVQTYEQWIQFACDPDDLPAMISQLTPVSAKDVQFPIRMPDWWAIIPETATRFNFYTNGEDIYVAIEKEQPRVWLWRNLTISK